MSEPAIPGLPSQYRIRRELASGGMALVYVADDLKHGRRVAIKVFRPELAGAIGAERFLREIQVAANLHHPHILPLYDSGQADGLLYYVMPLIEGETLAERIARCGQMALDEVLSIAGEVADALDHAHRQGLVHRDVKPANIMLYSGHAVVMDFGICRALDEAGSDALTRAGIALGTPAYMSPEQWSQPDRVDARSDIYSLGCIVYEMLAGEPPYTGATPQALLAKHTQQQIPSLRILRPDLPPALEAVLARALAKVREERFSSALEFAQHLAAFRAPGALTLDAPSPAPPRAAVPATHDAGTAGSARTSRRMLLATIAVVLLAGTATAIALVNRDDAAPAPALTAERVVVGAFENRTGNSEHDALGRMVADWIAEGLHRTGAVDVVPSPDALQASEFVRSALEAGDRRGPIQILAEETGAGIVVSGAYYEIGGRLQFQLQVSNAATSTLIAALEPVEAAVTSPTTAIQELRDRVMGALAITLDERLSVPGAAERPPDFEAYRTFSHGLERYVRNEDRAAVPELLRAYELDTTFVVPLLYAAFSLSNMGELARADSIVRVLAGRRSELSEYDRNWLEYLERQLQADRDGGLRAIRRAAGMAPASKASYNRAYAAQLANRPGEMLEALSALDPERGPMRGWFPYWDLLSDAHHRLGNHEEELRAARRAAALFPERHDAVRMQAEALAAMGPSRQLEQLLDSVAGSRSRPEAGPILTAAAVELRAHGHAGEADRVLDRALAWYAARPANERETEEHRVGLATLLHEALSWPDARQVVEQLRSDFPDQPTYRAWVGIIAAAQGETAVANAADRWLSGFEPPYSYGVFRLQRARIAAHTAGRDRIVELYADALQHGLRPPRHLDRNFEQLWRYAPLQTLLAPRS